MLKKLLVWFLAANGEDMVCDLIIAMLQKNGVTDKEAFVIKLLEKVKDLK